MTAAPLHARPIDGVAFRPYGDVIAAEGAPDALVNGGRCGRYHDLARLDFGDGRAGLSLFESDGFDPPLALAMMERHPLGSQAFLPLNGVPMLVVVAEDAGGAPGPPAAFITASTQGVNLLRGVWHGVLAPLGPSGLYAVIDRIGPGDNLEEHRFERPLTVTVPGG
ncbi:ureidoglycolate lyase [Roseovarius salinarum]|uniref:ureidoglycolate lyase n=1 Tax=Roseovarius salinarum TaxID=1981892 RepID=UPI000C342B03|nr:ureidoglycolate lyase [Roseovarius salinarum]